MYNEGENGSLCPYFGGNINGCFNQTDLQNMSACFDYYLSRCVPYNPSDSCISDSLNVGGGGIELTPAVVDSVMTAFNLGFQSGILSFIKIVIFAVVILIIVSLVNYVISKQ